jgi:hypothetical protein
LCREEILNDARYLLRLQHILTNQSRKRISASILTILPATLPVFGISIRDILPEEEAFLLLMTANLLFSLLFYYEH